MQLMCIKKLFDPAFADITQEANLVALRAKLLSDQRNERLVEVMFGCYILFDLVNAEVRDLRHLLNIRITIKIPIVIAREQVCKLPMAIRRYDRLQRLFGVGI